MQKSAPRSVILAEEDASSASSVRKVTAAEIESIASWEPRRPRGEAVDREAALEARRQRAGGDVSLDVSFRIRSLSRVP